MNTTSDPISEPLKRIGVWLLKGELTFLDTVSSEVERLKRFHALMKRTAKRFTGDPNLNNLGWFLKQEGNGIEQRFHFHFIVTADHLYRSKAETVCRYMVKQWGKIAGSRCEIEPWDRTKAEKGIDYISKLPPYRIPHSSYFGGDVSHWRLSPLLLRRLCFNDCSPASGTTTATATTPAYFSSIDERQCLGKAWDRYHKLWDSLTIAERIPIIGEEFPGIYDHLFDKWKANGSTNE